MYVRKELFCRFLNWKVSLDSHTAVRDMEGNRRCIQSLCRQVYLVWKQRSPVADPLACYRHWTPQKLQPFAYDAVLGFAGVHVMDCFFLLPCCLLPVQLTYPIDTSHVTCEHYIHHTALSVCRKANACDKRV